MKKFLIVISTIVIFFTIFSIKTLAVPLKINYLVKEMVQDLVLNLMNDKYLSNSSNPYDYIINNKNYEAIVSLGPDAIPYLEHLIKSSENSGLIEYILAIAIEEIGKVDLKKGSEYRWTTAKKFPLEWEKHLEKIPSEVKKIAYSNDTPEIKNKELIKLGTPSIPYIIDLIDDGIIELSPSLYELVKDNKWLNNEIMLEDLDLLDKEWIENNKSRFNGLRKLVESVQKN